MTWPSSCGLCDYRAVLTGQVLYLGFNRITDISALCLERMPYLLAVDLQVRYNSGTHIHFLLTSLVETLLFTCTPA